jgi:hypothetical protein
VFYDDRNDTTYNLIRWGKKSDITKINVERVASGIYLYGLPTTFIEPNLEGYTIYGPGFIGQYNTEFKLLNDTYYLLSDNPLNGGVGFENYVERSSDEKYIFGSRGTIALKKGDELTFINAPDSINFRYGAYTSDTLLLWGEYSAGYARPTDFTFGYVTNNEFHQTISYSVSDDYFIGAVKDMKRMDGKWLVLFRNDALKSYEFGRGILPINSSALIEGAIISDTSFAKVSIFLDAYTVTKGARREEHIKDSNGDDLILAYYPDKAEYKHGLLVIADGSNINIIELDN